MKLPVWCKNLLHNCYTRTIIADLVLKFSNFCYHGNKGRSKVNINDTIKLANFKKTRFDAVNWYICPVQAK